MSPRRNLPGTLAFSALWVGLTALSGLLLYAGLALWVSAWRFHPVLAQGATVAVCALAVLAGLLLMRGGHAPGRDEHHGDGGDDGPGGGEPPPAPRPGPRGPGGAAPDWERFDRVRAEWDRVPAGR